MPKLCILIAVLFAQLLTRTVGLHLHQHLRAPCEDCSYVRVVYLADPSVPHLAHDQDMDISVQGESGLGLVLMMVAALFVLWLALPVKWLLRPARPPRPRFDPRNDDLLGRPPPGWHPPLRAPPV